MKITPLTPDEIIHVRETVNEIKPYAPDYFSWGSGWDICDALLMAILKVRGQESFYGYLTFYIDADTETTEAAFHIYFRDWNAATGEGGNTDPIGSYFQDDVESLSWDDIIASLSHTMFHSLCVWAAFTGRSLSDEKEIFNGGLGRKFR